MRRLIVAVVVFLIAAPVFAQDEGVAWEVKYYDNGYLIGDAAKEETLYGPIGLDWGEGTPGRYVPSDNFSVRLTTYTYFPAGVYRFDLFADDGVALRVGHQKLIDTFETGRAGVNLSAEVELPEGFHNVQIDYREAEGVAFLYASWANALDPVDPNTPLSIVSGPRLNQGFRWDVEIFNNTELAGIPTFRGSTPSPMVNWREDAPVEDVNEDAFSIRFTSEREFQAATYRIAVRADDGIRVYVDGQPVIDQWFNAMTQNYEATVDLAAGDHTITLEYVERGGQAFLDYNLIRLESRFGDPFVGTDAVPQPVGPFENETALQAPAPPTPEVPQTGVSATITAETLNVRAEPRVVRGNVVATADGGASYPVLARANNGWVQIQVGSTQGWINGRFASIPDLLTLPVTVEGPTD